MNSNESRGLSRRRLLALGGSAALGGAALRSPLLHGAPEAGARQWIASLTQSDEETGITLPSAEDPVALSAAENRFWSQVLMEHAQMFTMLMLPPRLSGPRGEAEKFLSTFMDRADDARKTEFTRDNYKKFNQATAEHARKFAEWKLGMRDEQAAGRLQSLVWPSFFGAASTEAKRFATRLERINAGTLTLERDEVVGFWMSDGADHTAMIAHLLDPEEHRLIHQAKEYSKKCSELRALKPGKEGGNDPVMETARDLIAFEATIHQGIQDGRIHSIINPMMADHMHREHLRFMDELKRAQ